MKLTSNAFHHGGIIPSLYTCEGKDINPPLEINGVPPAAKSLVLLMDDPDVPPEIRPTRMYDHWILFNIPAHTRKIAENSVPSGICGRSSSGENDYVGPCPPYGEHRYFFKLYALDTVLNLPAGSTKQEVEKAMQGHIVAQCELMGRYEKGKRH